MTSSADLQVDIDHLVGAAIEKTIDELGEVGVQVAAYRDGELIVDAWGGMADQETGQPVVRDTVFNVFSVTKAVTATAVHVLAERGLIDYDEPIATYWPEFAAHGKGGALVKHALSHRVGLPAMPEGITLDQLCDWEEMVRQIAAMPPMFAPGTKSAYHGYTFGWIIGELVRRADPQGRRVDVFVAEEICQPLGIESLWLGIPPEVESRVAPLRDEVKRLPDSTDSATLNPVQRMGRQAIPPEIGTSAENYMRSEVRAACLPATGAIADARSVARFFAMIAGGGELDGIRLLSEPRLRWCATRPAPVPDDEFDLEDKVISWGGFHLAVPDHGQPSYYHAIGRGSGLLMHAGTGGQLGWADLDRNLSVAIVHNRLFSPFADAGRDPLTIIAESVRAAVAARR